MKMPNALSMAVAKKNVLCWLDLTILTRSIRHNLVITRLRSFPGGCSSWFDAHRRHRRCGGCIQVPGISHYHLDNDRSHCSSHGQISSSLPNHRYYARRSNRPPVSPVERHSSPPLHRLVGIFSKSSSDRRRIMMARPCRFLQSQ